MSGPVVTTPRISMAFTPGESSCMFTEGMVRPKSATDPKPLFSSSVADMTVMAMGTLCTDWTPCRVALTTISSSPSELPGPDCAWTPGVDMINAAPVIAAKNIDLVWCESCMRVSLVDFSRGVAGLAFQQYKPRGPRSCRGALRLAATNHWQAGKIPRITAAAVRSIPDLLRFSANRCGCVAPPGQWGYELGNRSRMRQGFAQIRRP